MFSASGAIVYVSFGKGRHVEEVIASILSAARFASTRDGRVRLAVVTDTAAAFRDLPAELLEIDDDTARSWRGPDDYIYNVKLHGLLHALEYFQSPVAVLDGDTYFRRDPLRLLQRIGPGHSVMHIRECSLGQIDQPGQIDMRDALQGHTYTTRRGDTLTLGNGMPVWNSGVVGIHPADAALVEEAIDLSACITRLSGSRTAEQMALGQLLERYTRLRATRDLVFHYWWPPVRRDFSNNLPRLLKASETLTAADRWSALEPHRPRYTCPYRVKRWIREKVLVPVGLRERFYPMS